MLLWIGLGAGVVIATACFMGFYWLGPVHTTNWSDHWWLLSQSLKKPVPEMEGFMTQLLSKTDYRRARLYNFLTHKFFGTRLANVGARGMGRLHGKYNWPSGAFRVVP